MIEINKTTIEEAETLFLTGWYSHLMEKYRDRRY
jgi:hypothetical protein